MTETEILEKIAKAKNGDKLAFGELFTHFYGPVFRFVMFRTKGDRDKAEDIVSQAFLNWYESLQNYTVDKKPLNYLYLIASRLLINEGKKTGRYVDVEDQVLEEVRDENISLESLADIKVEYEKVKEVIDTELNETEQQLIYLKYVEEKENEEIANILEKTENNIRQIEYRALKKVRVVLKQKYES